MLLYDRREEPEQVNPISEDNLVVLERVPLGLKLTVCSATANCNPGRGERGEGQTERVLLERTFHFNGIDPFQRAQRVAAKLKQAFALDPDREDNRPAGVPQFLGYMNLPMQSEKYRQPHLIHSLPNNQAPLHTLQDYMAVTGYRLSLESRWSIAVKLAEAVFNVHAAGLVHRDISSNTILFLERVEAEPIGPGDPKEEADPNESDRGRPKKKR